MGSVKDWRPGNKRTQYPPRIIVVISGGLVQGIASDVENAEIFVADLDNIENMDPDEIPKSIDDMLYAAEMGEKKVDRYINEIENKLRNIRRQ